MYYPYMTLGDTTEVVHSEWDGEKTIVHFEKPDEVFCFKTLDCTVPGYVTSDILGFSEEDVARLVSFCKDNASLLIEYSKCGGIANA